MNRSRLFLIPALAACASFVAVGDAYGGAPTKEKKDAKADIYDRTADGGEQIAEALTIAKRNNQRVLLMFGANWCSWCHKLHHVFETDKAVARILLYEYVLVLIDVDKVDGKKHNADIDARYGYPTKQGLPVFVVLDADGKQLTTQETEALEEGDHHDPAKVAAFLKKWQPDPQSAPEVLSAGLARAKSESKNVFLHFSAPWCSWCKKLDRYLHQPEIADAFGSAYVSVKIDVDRMTGGKAMVSEYREGKRGGIPYFVLLDSSGKTLADSIGPTGNVGFPVTPEEVGHFMKVIRQTAPQMSSAALATLKSGLKPTS